MGQVFKVKTAFREFEPGQLVSIEDVHASGADPLWLVGNGALEPMTAGAVALMSAGIDPVTLMDEVESLTNKTEPLVKSHAALREHAEALHATTKSALEMARERGEQLAEVVRSNGEYAASLGLARTRIADLERRGADVARERDEHKARADAAEAKNAEFAAQIEALKAEAPDDSTSTTGKPKKSGR